MCRVATLICILTITTQIHAASLGTIYVHNRSGNDRYDGRSAVAEGTGVGPVRSLQKAIRLAMLGDQIVLLPSGVPYRESVTITGRPNLSTHRSPLVIEGNGAEFAGDVPVDPVDWIYFRKGTYRLGSCYHPVGILFSYGQPVTRSSESSELSSGITNPGEYQMAHGSYHYHPKADESIEAAKLSVPSLPAAILIHRASHVTIRNLRIRGFRIDGIQVKGPLEGVRFENCEIIDNLRSGISFLTNAKADLVDIHIHGHQNAGIIVDNHSAVQAGRISLTDNARESHVGSTSKLKQTGDPSPFSFGPPNLPPPRPRVNLIAPPTHP